jgi:hypothetical protein
MQENKKDQEGIKSGRYNGTKKKLAIWTILNCLTIIVKGNMALAFVQHKGAFSMGVGSCV